MGRRGSCGGGGGVLRVARLGMQSYAAAHAIMEGVAAEITRQRGENEDTVIMVEHMPVYTLGKRGDESMDLPAGGRRALKATTGADVVDVGRGGRTTFHGPGQCVMYPVVDLRRRKIGARAYVETLEDAMLEAAARAGLRGAEARRPGAPGVYVGERKLGAVGVKISMGIATHGAAINVHTDLSYFDRIVPCGVDGMKATSLRNEIGTTAPSMEEVEDSLLAALARMLGYTSTFEVDVNSLASLRPRAENQKETRKDMDARESLFSSTTTTDFT